MPHTSIHYSIRTAQNGYLEINRDPKLPTYCELRTELTMLEKKNGRECFNTLRCATCIEPNQELH